MSNARDFFGNGVGGGVGMIPLLPPSGMWNSTQSRPDFYKPSGFFNDGDNFDFFFSGTTTLSSISYYNAAGSLQWTKTAGNLGGEYLLGHMLDTVEGRLYVLYQTSVNVFRISAINSFGTITWNSNTFATTSVAAQYDLGWWGDGVCTMYRETQGSGDIFVSCGLTIDSTNAQGRVDTTTGVYTLDKVNVPIQGYVRSETYPEFFVKFITTGGIYIAHKRDGSSDNYGVKMTGLSMTEVGLPNLAGTSTELSWLQWGPDYWYVGSYQGSSGGNNKAFSRYSNVHLQSFLDLLLENHNLV